MDGDLRRQASPFLRLLWMLDFGDTPSTSEDLLVRVQDALAEEIGLILAQGVVATAQDIDHCMLTRGGWPLHLGGNTPHLDRVGASQRVNGRLFHLGLNRASTGNPASLSADFE